MTLLLTAGVQANRDSREQDYESASFHCEDMQIIIAAKTHLEYGTYAAPGMLIIVYLLGCFCLRLLLIVLVSNQDASRQSCSRFLRELAHGWNLQLQFLERSILVDERVSTLDLISFCV